MNFKGATTLVTGASYGIGASFARQLAQRGSNLILTARSKDKLETLASQLEKGFGIKTHVMVSDLSRPEGALALFEEVSRAGLQVDFLINNAGFGTCEHFANSSLEKNEAMIRLNVNALVQLTRLFVKPMAERRKGGVMNIASTAGFQPLPKMALYAATKAFVLSFTEALWSEYKKQGVRVFCLCPGNTESQFHLTAGVHQRRIFFRASADDLVRFGLDKFSKTDQPTAVFGFRNKFLAFGNRLLPRRAVLFITSKIYK